MTMHYKTLFEKAVNSLAEHVILYEDGGEYAEGGSLNAGAVNQGNALTDFGTYRIEFPKAFRAVQAFLSNYSGKPVLDPEGLLSVVKMKLNILGLDFKYNNQQLPMGIHMFKLFQGGSPDLGVVGQKFGQDMNKEPIVNGDDGITSKLGHPLFLKAELIDNNGKTIVNLTLSPGPSDNAMPLPQNQASPLQGN